MSNPQVTIGVTAVDKAGAVLQSVDQKIAQTATNVDTASSKIVSRTSQMSAQVKQNFGQIATSAASLAAGITSFAFSFGTIEKAQASAMSQQITYEKSLQRLEKLQNSGKATAEQLATAELEVANNANKLKIAQDQVSESYTQFLAQIPSQMIAFGHGFSGMLQNISGKSIPQLLSGLKTLNLTMISTFVTSPWGIALIAGASLIAIFAFNVGGLRDRIFELGDAIMRFLYDHFRPLHDAIKWFIDNVAKPFAGFFSTSAPESIDTTSMAFETLNKTTLDLGSSMPTALMQVESAFGSLEAKGVQSANNILAAYERMKNGVSSSVTSIFDPGFRDGVFGRSGSGSAVNAARTVTLTNFRNPAGGVQLSARVAQNGLDEFLPQDTVIFAHKGEHAKITPAGQSSGGRGGPLHIHLDINGREFATAIIADIESARKDYNFLHRDVKMRFANP